MRIGKGKYIKRVLQIGLPLLVVLIFIYQGKNTWHELTKYTFQWNPWLVGLAIIGFVLQELSYGLIWRAVLVRLGYQLDLRPCLRIYLASEFVRYIPGNIWHVVTRILWVSKYGVSRPIAFASIMIELITKLAAGVLVFAISLLFWQNELAAGLLRHEGVLIVLGVGIILALLIILHPRILNRLLNTALRLLKRDAIVLPLHYGDILLVTLAWCISWIGAGCAFYFLLHAVWPATPLIALPICIGIYAIGWDIGFVSFVTPSGLIFREGAIVVLCALSLSLPIGLATIIALLSRFVSTIVELICVSVAYVSGGGKERQLQASKYAQGVGLKETV